MSPATVLSVAGPVLPAGGLPGLVVGAEVPVDRGAADAGCLGDLGRALAAGPAPSITSQTIFTLHGADDGRLGSKARPTRAKRRVPPEPRSLAGRGILHDAVAAVEDRASWMETIRITSSGSS